MELISLLYTIQYLFIQLVFFIFLRNNNSTNNNSYNGGISILIPSYDEIYTIKQTIDSIINSKREFPIEIIIIDDGKGSATLNHLKHFYNFEIIDFYKDEINNPSIRHIYHTTTNINIYVIDKENEGKSKALNVALKLIHYKYFITIDADTIIDKNCLYQLSRNINDHTLGIGGNIKPIRYKGSIIGRILNFYQRWEYFRNFSFSRIAFNNFNCVPLLSGALSLFNKEAVIEVGGYSSETLGEDFDLTLKLHEYAKKYKGEIKYCHKAIAYTQVPFDIKSFYKQRLRWQIGMLQVLNLHKKLLIEISVLSIILHLINLYEFLSTLIEIIIFIIFIKTKSLLLITLSIISMIQLLFIKYINQEIEDSNLLFLSILQLFTHIMYLFIRIISIYKLLLKNNNTWGIIKRNSNS